MRATSDSFYILSPTSGTSPTAVTSSATGTIITSTGQAISIQSRNYPRNRLYSSIYTFALTRPSFIVSTLQIDLPSTIIQSAEGVSCAYQGYEANDNYFSLMRKQGTNILSCQISAQKLTITGLSSVIGNISSNSFLYLTVSGLLNPQTSTSRLNFTFTFINTTSTFTQAVLLFTIPLSYTISNPPFDMQISSIQLSNSKFFSVSDYTFQLSSVSSANLIITKQSSIGLTVRFPKEYEEIWNQITIPGVVNMTIGANTYQATNVTMASRYLFAVFPESTFSSQLTFTTFSISFTFRNPNRTVDCTVLPVFVISLFDFKSNSIYSQTLSNNVICPNLTTYLYGINITGNTKISAGSSSPFFVTLEQPAYSLSITPSCASSAISFSPATIVF